MSRSQCILTLICTCWSAISVDLVALEIYVSPRGDASGTGGRNDPFADLVAARDALRASGKLGQEPCTVWLLDGTYRLESSLRLEARDSGSDAAPVVWRAVNPGNVTITGAQLPALEWTLWRDGIYRALIGKVDRVDQLFVDGQRKQLARYPNFQSGFVVRTSGKAGTAPYDGCAPDAWDRTRAARWADPSGAIMHGMHRALWGGMHFRVLGKNSDGSLKYEGGWQNNRLASGSHKSYRMIENVFEELDAPGEWYHDQPGGWLYYQPGAGEDIEELRFEVVFQINHLVEIYGQVNQPVGTLTIEQPGNGLEQLVVAVPETITPVRHIGFAGLRFAGTRRTFMETREPLLRSDWTVYRGGAVHVRGAEYIVLENNTFEELGGNAVFVDGYNRHVTVRGNYFNSNGATDVSLVGSPAAVRCPRFGYHAPPYPLNEVDRRVGPKTEEYPADCLVEDNLMLRCGRYEKQTAGVNISMASRITVRHNTIAHTPRAAINICDGTWGGHLIEWNDCFETVLETSDHGSFNSWGRDRYWHPASPAGPRGRDKNGKPLISYWIESDAECPLWDAYQTTILRHNRMQCDHGWDIDLDDGSTNYEIYNNLCLSGGIKTREGFRRRVYNNVSIGASYTCNVPYPGPTDDSFTRNILWGGAYRSANPKLWSGDRNSNFFHDPAASGAVPALGAQSFTGDDKDSLYGNARFIDPLAGDFSVADDSPALAIGFQNFAMHGFGVTAQRLKQMAPVPRIREPQAMIYSNVPTDPEDRGRVVVLGAFFRAIDGMEAASALGSPDTTGAHLYELPGQSRLKDLGFQVDDVIRALNGRKVKSPGALRGLFKNFKPGKNRATVLRGQQIIEVEF